MSESGFLLRARKNVDRLKVIAGLIYLARLLLFFFSLSLSLWSSGLGTFCGTLVREGSNTCDPGRSADRGYLAGCMALH